MSQAMMTLDTRAAERRIKEIALTAAKGAVGKAARWAEKDLERVTRAAVGGKLYKAWSSQVYPRNGLANEPSAYIFPKGGARTRGAIKFFATAGTFRARSGKYMWLPTPAARRLSRRPAFTPRAWELANRVKLRPVFRPGKPPLLVLDPRGIGIAASRPKKVITIFVGLKTARKANKFSIEPSILRASARMGAEFVKQVQALDNRI